MIKDNIVFNVITGFIWILQIIFVEIAQILIKIAISVIFMMDAVNVKKDFIYKMMSASHPYFQATIIHKIVQFKI